MPRSVAAGISMLSVPNPDVDTTTSSLQSQYFNGHTLRRPDPQGARTVEDLLDLVSVRAVDDDDI